MGRVGGKAVKSREGTRGARSHTAAVPAEEGATKGEPLHYHATCYTVHDERNRCDSNERREEGENEREQDRVNSCLRKVYVVGGMRWRHISDNGEKGRLGKKECGNRGHLACVGNCGTIVRHYMTNGVKTDENTAIWPRSDITEGKVV